MFAFSRLPRLWRKTPYGILAVGGFAIAAAALVWTYAAWRGESMAVIPAEPDVPAAALVEQAPAPPVTGSPRLRIASIGVDMPIVEGKNEQALLRGAWRSPYNSTPDRGGNTVLFGHRWLHKPPNPETFYNLDKVRVGDTFTLDWKGKTYTYRVVETKVVAPTEISVLRQTSTPTITLITCTPLYTTKQRLIVRAELVLEIK